ncbi:hypothetical protein [Bdellovibrio sp. BCCA]|uniref:hypothetical protein n=1 Tax=Bdellovibrio sp. BCCA TaxID=3136281 RepID=UPI0030F16D46
MKTLSLLFASFVFCLITNSAQAQGEQSTEGGQGSLPNVFSDETMTLPDFAERLLTPNPDSQPGTQTYTCRAWTTCPGGYRISCWSRGYRCYSEVTPGYRVYCSATSKSGYTKYWVYYCY